MIDDQRSRIGDAFEAYAEKSRFPWAWLIIVASVAYLVIHLIAWAWPR
mgnify:FL=1